MDKKEFEAFIDKNVRPALQDHGGDIELLELTDTAASFKMLGNCSGCPSAQEGTKAMIKEIVQRAYPQIEEIEIDNSVSEELLDFARAILSGEKKL